jgi:hypothetical protein
LGVDSYENADIVITPGLCDHQAWPRTSIPDGSMILNT